MKTENTGREFELARSWERYRSDVDAIWVVKRGREVVGYHERLSLGTNHIPKLEPGQWLAIGWVRWKAGPSSVGNENAPTGLPEGARPG